MDPESGVSRPHFGARGAFRSSRDRGSSRSGRNHAARLPRLARLTDSATLTPTGTVRLNFEVIDEEPFDFVPGQFVAIDMNDPVVGYKRSPYCLMDGSEQGRCFELLIRRVSDGPVSLFLADLELGDIISFRGPNGHPMVPTGSHDNLIMVATGVGLSPCYCYLRGLEEAGTHRQVRLYWGLRLPSDICLIPELDRLASAIDGFEYSITLSSPNDEWQGLRGRVTESVPPLLETLSEKRFCLISNGAMIAQMSLALQNLGVSRDDIYEESFFNHRHRPDAHQVCDVEDRFVATDIERPIDRLERELSRYRMAPPAAE